ncbi:hypothetical protein LVJ94_42665 [Pendulispora rubella]|uniref:Uncharacterized protein n=2 Tax=Pendulispora TaxID=3375062 RepID=A0ABZ2K323_9BACT
MSQFVVTQRFMSLATNYDVTAPGSEDVLLTIKGTLMSPTPLFSLVEGTNGKELATLRGNFAKTQFHVLGADGKELATVDFPAIALKKKLALKIGDREYTADGGVFSGVFQCKDAGGNIAIEISKVRSVRDKFSVVTKDDIGQEVGLLAAVAIHSRFFEMV